MQKKLTLDELIFGVDKFLEQIRYSYFSPYDVKGKDNLKAKEVLINFFFYFSKLKADTSLTLDKLNNQTFKLKFLCALHLVDIEDSLKEEKYINVCEHLVELDQTSFILHSDIFDNLIELFKDHDFTQQKNSAQVEQN